MSDSLQPMNCNMPGFPGPHHLPEFAQTHESVILSNHLILCHRLLLLPSVFPSNRVFSNVSAPHIGWPKYWSFSFSISPSNEYSGLIWLIWSPCMPSDSQESSPSPQLLTIEFWMSSGLNSVLDVFFPGMLIRKAKYCFWFCSSVSRWQAAMTRFTALVIGSFVRAEVQDGAFLSESWQVIWKSSVDYLPYPWGDSCTTSIYPSGTSLNSLADTSVKSLLKEVVQ